MEVGIKVESDQDQEIHFGTVFGAVQPTMGIQGVAVTDVADAAVVVVNETIKLIDRK